MTEAEHRAIVQRAANRCEYCRCLAGYGPGGFAIEHIFPRVHGGSDATDNLAWACFGCNGHKATAVDAVDPDTGVVAPLFHPRRDRWTDHFAWSSDLINIVGTTPRGRATVEKLQMNSPNLQNYRRILLAVNLHPPVS